VTDSDPLDGEDSRSGVPARTGNYQVDVIDLAGHGLVDDEVLRETVVGVLSLEGIEEAMLSVAVVDNDTIGRANDRFLDHDGPTDVLTFPLGDGPAGGRIDAEVIVSSQMAVDVAAAHGHTPARELLLYVVHGLLHLCGYDDVDENDRAAMRRREAELLEVLVPPADPERLREPR